MFLLIFKYSKADSVIIKCRVSKDKYIKNIVKINYFYEQIQICLKFRNYQT